MSDVGLLFRVGDEVEDPRGLELAPDPFVHLGLPVKVELPVAPFDSPELVFDVEEETEGVNESPLPGLRVVLGCFAHGRLRPTLLGWK